MTDESSEVDFFGARIKVRSARLAALLNSDLSEDVVVVGRRAVDLVISDDADAEPSDQDQEDDEE